MCFKGYYSFHESIFQIHIWTQKFTLCMTSSLIKSILLCFLISSAFSNFKVRYIINDYSDVSLPTENLLFLILKVDLSGYTSDSVCVILLSMFFIFQEETVELKILNFKNLWNLLWKKNPSQGGNLEKSLDKLAQMACSVIIHEKNSNTDS